MSELALYDHPSLYDLLVRPGLCEQFYCDVARDMGGPILELACGTGRLTVPLALTGMETIGVDSSAAMIEAARAKATVAGASASFIQGDMRSFDLSRRFALVVVSCNSLSHLTENEDLTAALSRILRHLAPGGLFAFDIGNPQIRDLAREEEMSIRINAARPDVNASEVLIAYDPVQQVRLLKWEVREPGRVARKVAPMRLRAIFPQELPFVLNAAGLELVSRFGDFERGPLTGGSLNQVCLARASGQNPWQEQSFVIPSSGKSLG
jgi:SAM-dependent methyltransferase